MEYGDLMITILNMELNRLEYYYKYEEWYEGYNKFN